MLIVHKDLGICEVLKEFTYDTIPHYVVQRFDNHVITGIPVSEAEDL